MKSLAIHSGSGIYLYPSLTERGGKGQDDEGEREGGGRGGGCRAVCMGIFRGPMHLFLAKAFRSLLKTVNRSI